MITDEMTLGARWAFPMRARMNRRRTGRLIRLIGATALLAAVSSNSAAGAGAGMVAPTNAPAVAAPAAPRTPREFFNAGTQKLAEGKLREAEMFLQTALARQDERVQPAALYNLGEVRFAQGNEELKKAPDGRPTAARGRSAAQQAADATRAADEALSGNDMQKMIQSYVRGRGTRKDLRVVTEALRRALELYGATLKKWQRASGDFRSAAELNPSDTSAQHNAEVMDRAIARLVDRLNELVQAALSLGDQSRRLNERLRQLKGRIPASMMPPGAGGDDEDEDVPFGLQLGQQEGASKEGKEMSLSREEAGQLLDGFKLDGDRRLPMGQGEEGKPKDRSGPTW